MKMTEASEAKRIKASLNKNSGRGKFDKGDATVGPFTVDIKEYGKSFSLTEEVWAKICTDAITNRNEPALKIVINGRTRMMVIGEDMFNELMELWEAANG